MKRIVFAVSVLTIVAPSCAWAACPAGNITCLTWCQKYGGDTCMTGHWNSCDKKRRGSAACVPDRPRSR
jgi:hypothetical protein